MIKRLFKKTPGGFGRISVKGSDWLTPMDIYEYSLSFRGVYKRASPILKKFKDPAWAESSEVMQFYGKAQSLAVQIAVSNELLIKAILLASTGSPSWGHNLKDLINELDPRYREIIKNHLEKNGLKAGQMNKVIQMSADIFVVARYGFENKAYELDFYTLQLLNESLDYIYNNFTPDWRNLTTKEQKDKKRLKKETDLLFDTEYQAERKRQWRQMRKLLEKD